MNEPTNQSDKPLTKEQFYGILFGDKAKEILKQEKAKEFYDKMHHNKNETELIKGRLWYTGYHVFTEFDCSKESRAKKQLEMLKI